MIKLRLFVLTALVMLFTVATAMAQSPAATAAANNTGGSWFFPAMGSFAVGIAAFGAHLATAARSPRLAKARLAIREPAAEYSQCCCLASR